MFNRSGLSVERCLFCLNNCSSYYLETPEFTIPGAGNCNTLRKELVQYFIVQKLLDIPNHFVETLQQKHVFNCDKETRMIKKEIEELMESDESASIDKQVKTEEYLLPQEHQTWFNICEKCSKRCVEPAWKAYQKLVALELKIRMIKDNIKATMLDNIYVKKRNKRWYGFTGEGLDVEIRKILFPDVLKKKKVAPRRPELIVVQDRPHRTPRQKTEESSYIFGFGLDSPEHSEHSPPEPEIEIDEDVNWEPELSPSPDEKSDADETYIPTSSTRLSENDTDKAKKKKKRVRKTNPSSSTSASSAEKIKKRIRKRKPRRRPEDLKRFKCSECGCYFNTAEDLSKHVLAHEKSKQNGGGPYDCEKCSYPAETQEELALHLKKRHGRNRSHRCPKCGFRGRSWTKLKIHVVAEHPELSDEVLGKERLSLNCSVCSRQFLRLENFVIHQKKMHPELFGENADEPVECTECGRKFISQIRLDYHIANVHSKSSEKKYVCDECGKAFQRKSRLEDHVMVVHQNATRRPYICHLCGLDYSYQWLLNQHYRRVHPGETDAGGDIAEQKNSGEEYKCRYCDLTSPYQVVIKRHLKTHKEETGLKCEQCGNCFMTEQSLRRHLRINHPAVHENYPCPYCLKPFASLDYMKHHVSVNCRVKKMECTPTTDPIAVAEAPQTQEDYTATSSFPEEILPTLPLNDHGKEGQPAILYKIE